MYFGMMAAGISQGPRASQLVGRIADPASQIWFTGFLNEAFKNSVTPNQD
jgi:hypothetical protein